MLPGPVLDEDLHVACVGGAAVEHLRGVHGVTHQLADVGVLQVGQARSVPPDTIILCQEKKKTKKDPSY